MLKKEFMDNIFKEVCNFIIERTEKGLLTYHDTTREEIDYLADKAQFINSDFSTTHYKLTVFDKEHIFDRVNKKVAYFVEKFNTDNIQFITRF